MEINLNDFISTVCQLVEAIKTKDKDTARNLILHHPDINFHHQSAGRSLLHWAVINFDDTEIIELLLNKEVDINAISDSDETALNLAVSMKKIGIVELLLRKGALKMDDLKISIRLASQMKHKQLLELLFQYILCLQRKKISQFYFFAYMATKDGQTRAVEDFLKLGIDVNMISDSIGMSLLHVACLYNHADVVQVLIKYQADVNFKIYFEKISSAARKLIEPFQLPDGVSALFIATVTSPQPLIASLLVDRGAIIEHDPNCHLILDTVVKEKWITILDKLMDHGLKLHITTLDQTVLLNFVADSENPSTQTSDSQTPKLLLNQGIDINYLDDKQETLLFHAIRLGNIKIAEALLNHQADIHHRNNDGNTPLHLATRYFIGTKFVELLLKYKARVNEVNADGLAPLHFACDEANIQKIHLLLKHNAEINVTDKFGKTPLHLVCTRNEVWVPEVLRLLARHSDDINFRDKKGKSPLFEACEVGSIPVIKILLEYGADMECKDQRGDTPLHVALKRFSRNWECVRSHLEAKKRSFTSHEERKPLYHCFAEYNFNISELLIQKELDINAVDGSGQTALHVAADRGHVDMVKDLLINGADVNAVDSYNLTALHYTRRRIAHFRDELYDHQVVMEFRHSYNMKNAEYCHYRNGCEKVSFYKREINSYKRIRNILHAQVIKLKCANLAINNYLYDLVFYDDSPDDKTCDDFSDDEDENVYAMDMKHYENQCYREIEELKHEVIFNTRVTLYELLTSKLEVIAAYTRDVNVMNILRLNSYNHRFRYYIDIIRNRIKEAEKIMLTCSPRLNDFAEDLCFSDFTAGHERIYINSEKNGLQVSYQQRPFHQPSLLS